MMATKYDPLGPEHGPRVPMEARGMDALFLVQGTVEHFRAMLRQVGVGVFMIDNFVAEMLRHRALVAAIEAAAVEQHATAAAKEHQANGGALS